jgi:hypothetical protein
MRTYGSAGRQIAGAGPEAVDAIGRGRRIIWAARRRSLHNAAGPEPADGSGRAGRRIPVPGPVTGPGSAPARPVQWSPQPGRGGQDPAAEPVGERLRRKVGAHSPGQGHRPEAAHRAAAPAGRPGRIRRELPSASPVVGQDPAATRLPPHRDGPVTGLATARIRCGTLEGQRRSEATSIRYGDALV